MGNLRLWVKEVPWRLVIPLTLLLCRTLSERRKWGEGAGDPPA